MSLVKDYLERYNTGFPVFEKLFNLKGEELIETLKDICSHDSLALEVLEEKPNTYKSIENDIPAKIKICSWSTIEITPTGIYYKQEHGQLRDVILFTKFFKLGS